MHGYISNQESIPAAQYSEANPRDDGQSHPSCMRRSNVRIAPNTTRSGILTASSFGYHAGLLLRRER